VSLHCGSESHLLRETMDEIERQLDPQQFFRVHRSAIVNLARVREIHPLFRGDCELKLADGTAVKLSRNRRNEFEARFAQIGVRR
jgi:two-component system LytT family response regulator